MCKKPALLYVVDTNGCVSADTAYFWLTWKDVIKLLFHARKLGINLRVIWGFEYKTYFLNALCRIRHY